MGKGGQIWLKCMIVDLIMMIKYKNNIFERVKKNHADLAWSYPRWKIADFNMVDELHRYSAFFVTARRYLIPTSKYDFNSPYLRC